MAHKQTEGKPKLSLIPFAAMLAIVSARNYGIKKYGDEDGWKEVQSIDFIEAAARHIFKYLDGQEFDDESGLPHINHAITSLALAIGKEEHDLKYIDEDAEKYIRSRKQKG